MSKKCPECGSLNIEYLFEENESWCNDCGLHFQTCEALIASVFDHITESVEALANELVYQFIGYDGNGLFHGYWKSTITDEDYTTKEKAIAATVAELKKEYNKK